MNQPEPFERHSAHYGDLILEIPIEATIEEVWQGLTSGLASWWPDDGYAGGDSGKRKMILEAEPGGRMYESWDSGGGLLWGHVVTIEPQEMLQLVGHTFPKWGGPTMWYGTWELSTKGNETVLRYSETAIGRVEEENRAQTKKGWQWLLGGALKAHLEGKPCPPFE